MLTPLDKVEYFRVEMRMLEQQRDKPIDLRQHQSVVRVSGGWAFDRWADLVEPNVKDCAVRDQSFRVSKDSNASSPSMVRS